MIKFSEYFLGISFNIDKEDFMIELAFSQSSAGGLKIAK
ncbi:hypothetical protein Desde_3377 [Desulfitobacterium dehalogenans ATCC 51507]|uniref:Uncharacterized protein n=1 Tax=Desulfitobacterium dehalogenans (strain ATCC 51507 / DSM 9161 / JW/IU-DC1) TaxID=756499 RepID=I4ACH8_DESDJ|nr:hypothetical protein Desde_3377 [Desulfitobacterium dehalogenans ATCC 51507]